MKRFFTCTALGAALLAVSVGATAAAAGGTGSARSMQAAPDDYHDSDDAADDAFAAACDRPTQQEL